MQPYYLSHYCSPDAAEEVAAITKVAITALCQTSGHIMKPISRNQSRCLNPMYSVPRAAAGLTPSISPQPHDTNPRTK